MRVMRSPHLWLSLWLPAVIGPLALCAPAAAAPPAGSPLTPLPAQAADVPWPTSQWPTGPLPAGVSAQALEEHLKVVAAPHPVLGQTRAVVIIQGGRLVAERYLTGFGPDTALISWSVAKSVTQALVGIAVRQGLVDIDKPMGHPSWRRDDPRAAIPWRQWINMVDGQEFREMNAFKPTDNDSAHMLFGKGRFDVAGYGASLPLIHPPGTHWNYNSGGVNLVASALGSALAPGVTDPAARREKMRAFMKRELFEPLGMTSARPQFDATGSFAGSALLYATARDYARFGLLYLRDGMWEGRRLLPEGWVDFARTSTGARDGERYGGGWWVEPSDPAKRKGPPDLFRAMGHEGQLVVVVPSKDLVVVRLGLLDDRVGFVALGDWAYRLVGLFPGDPANRARSAL
jgi:CubicO group peptidase (beta-lactamase class C family)